ncbi:MAG: TIGR02206 family membrane protein [Saprospiraceae bacterium]|nr:TIGR02206 family membrane protein [Saprospiraceae bacterium]
MYLFAPNFVSYGAEHFAWLLFGALSTWFWIWYGRRQTEDLLKRKVGLVMSLIPALLWVGMSAYMVLYVQPVDLGLVLPFHVCYFLNLLMPVLMWRRSYLLFELFYFMVMAGCIQALITPDVQTTFPHFMNIRYFVIHMFLAQSILYAIFVFEFRPTWKSLKKSFVWSNVYFLFIILVNFVLDTNFMYLRKKPNTATLLDVFGDWPWYIIGAEFLALTLFAVVMLPFALPKLKKAGITDSPDLGG